MMILNMGRGTGKTTAAIRASAENKIPIICVAGAQRQFIKERAKSLSLEIPEPIAAKRIADWASLHLDKVIVDDIDGVMSVLLNAKVVSTTLSGDIVNIIKGNNDAD